MKNLNTTRTRMRVFAAGVVATLCGHSAPAQQFGGGSLRGLEVVVEQPIAVSEAAARASASTSVSRGSGGQPPAAVTQPVITGPTFRQPAGTATPPRGGNAPSTAQPLAQGWMDRSVHRDETLFTSARLCGYLADERERTNADQVMRDFLVARVKANLPGGFGIHSDSNNRLGTCRAEAIVNAASRRVVVTATVPASRFFVRITTPDAPIVGGAPGRLDPNFSIDYDLNIRATFLLPAQAGSKVVQESMHYSATNVRGPQTSSLTGNLLLAANGIVRFLGGPDFTAAIPREVHFAHGTLVRLDLDALNQPLAQRLMPNARIEIVPNTNRNLKLRVTTRPPEAGPIVN